MQIRADKQHRERVREGERKKRETEDEKVSGKEMDIERKSGHRRKLFDSLLAHQNWIATHTPDKHTLHTPSYILIHILTHIDCI